MKHLFLIVLLFSSSFTKSIAATKVPELVISSFNQKFPAATNVTWDKESEHEYEAEFKWKGFDYSAIFSDKGVWIETETPCSFSALPIKVKTSFNIAHKNKKPKSISKIETFTQGFIYEIEVQKGLKTIEYFYKEDGSETTE